MMLRTLRTAWLALCIGMLMVAPFAPVYAQEPTVNPSSPQGEIASAIHQTGQVTEAIGSATVVAIVLAVGSVLVTAAFIIGFFWFFVRPNQKTTETAVSAAMTLSTGASTIQLQTVNALNLHSENMAKVAAHMAEIETKKEASEGRKTAVDAINEHTDEAVKPAVEELKKLREEMGKYVTTELFNGTMLVFTNKLDKIIAELETRDNCNDTPTPDPAPEDAPPKSATMDAAEDEAKDAT